jgi:molybdate transport system ATP-binding protein
MTVEIDIGHRFPGFELEVRCSLARPGITALFGPSGSGKTTLINAVAGLLRPQRGRIVIAGETVLDTATKRFVPPRRRRVGYVFQDARLFPHLSVRSNLLFGWRRAARPAPAAEIDHVIELLGIRHLLERRVRHLSGGERQRVALGRALLSSPRLLLLDEPLAALDGQRRLEIMPYFERLRDETEIPMLYVSHSIDEVTRIADRMIVLDCGRVEAVGSIADITSRLDLFPHSGRFEAGAVVDMRVRGHDERYQLTEMAFADQRLLVPRLDSDPGAAIRVRIRARDITLALDAPARISANNVIAATVSGIHYDPGAHADVQIRVGDARLVARLTRFSVDRLGLAVGTPVYAIVKSVVVERRNVSALDDDSGHEQPRDTGAD